MERIGRSDGLLVEFSPVSILQPDHTAISTRTPLCFKEGEHVVHVGPGAGYYTAIMAELAGPDGAFLEGAGAMAASLVLMNRAMSIAGGTSEIKRNQIAERILGLPRDPLINN